jgi:transcriptional regulator with XRE-family HTH domain
VTERGGKDGGKLPHLVLVPKAPSRPESEAIFYGGPAASRSQASAVDRMIGQEIQKRRNELGISPKTFSLALGISSVSLAAYENGESRVAPELLLGMAAIFKCRPSALFQSLWMVERSHIDETQAADNMNQSEENDSSIEDRTNALILKIEMLVSALSQVADREVDPEESETDRS